MRIVSLSAAAAATAAIAALALAPGVYQAGANAQGRPEVTFMFSQDGETLAEHDGPDVLLLALLTTGAAGAAAGLALIGYVIRNRVGFWLHRPPEPKDGDDGGHH